MSTPAGMIEYLVLGPVEARRDGTPVPLGAAMLRRVLALLLHQPGRPVTVDHLIDAAWDGAPPPTARKTLQVYVRRLRQALGGDELRYGPAGYVMPVTADQVDASRFDALLARGLDARRDGALDSAAGLLEAALGLWRGEAYADLTCDALAGEVQRLSEQRLLAREEYVEIRLDLGGHVALLPELAVLVAANPFRERLTTCLMLALCRAGRQVEALEVYRRCTGMLAEELGVAPGPVLGWLHRTILRDDPVVAGLRTSDLDRIRRDAGAELELTRAEPVTSRAEPVTSRPEPVTSRPEPVTSRPEPATVPRQLPADVARFTGRRDALRELDAVSAEAVHGPVVAVISGTAGVGKTALAVRWAHRVAGGFPDGQLYVNLRGFDPAGAVVDPAEAIRRFLDALDVPLARVPPDLDAQAALYRTLLAQRRMLIVLDNARDAAQVRPLLPGTPGCLVVVTSRNRLASLVAADGAYPVVLDLLAPDEARDLLTRRLGPARVTAGTSAVDKIIGRCAGLPLALAIVAARAATHRDAPLAALAAELRDRQGWLDALAAGDDEHTDVRAVLSWSYRTLTSPAARLFRLLGLHPGPDISTPAAASLAGLTPSRLRPALTELVRAHLLVQHSPGRYTFHDLLRTYAAEQARDVEPAAERQAATRRMLDHYLHTAYPAALLLNANRKPIALATPEPGVSPERVTDQAGALAWFVAEHPVLLTAVERAESAGLDSITWQLAWTLTTFLERRGHWRDQETTQLASLAAAQRLGDASVQAMVHRNLSRPYLSLGRFDDARAHLASALALYQAAGDQLGQAYTHVNLGSVFERQGHHGAALDQVRQALGSFQAAGHRPGQADALNNLGWLYAQLGEYEQAIDPCRQAVKLYQELGDRYHDEAYAWDSLGYVHHHLGDHEQAIRCYRSALDLFQGLGDRYIEAVIATHLAEPYTVTGDIPAARQAYRYALSILEDLDHPDAGQVRGKLTALDDPPPDHADPASPDLTGRRATR